MGKQHEVNRNVEILGGLQRYDLAVFAHFSMGKQNEVNRNVEIRGGGLLQIESTTDWPSTC